MMPGVPFSSSSETSASPTLELGDHRFDVDLGIGAHRFGRRLDGLLIARRERAQRVLHAVAELAEHFFRNVDRVLRDEVDADALRANEPHDQLDLLEQRRRSIGEQQVRFVEEEHELRLFRVANLRQMLEQLGQQPQQEAWRRAAGLFISLSAARMLTTPLPSTV